MKKFINTLKYKLSWQTYKDAFFWLFVSICVFIDVVVMACIYDNPNIDSEIVMHITNFVFVMIFGEWTPSMDSSISIVGLQNKTDKDFRVRKVICEWM